MTIKQEFPILKVWAVPGRMVANFAAFNASPRRFIGYKANAELNRYESKDEPETIVCTNAEHFNEYARALRLGDLIPADNDTALAANITLE